MSNNRGNNRRRGRGNRSQGNNPVNRIDSRARGNAPQLLEKYRKLAQDASLNGDRVQAEYYLQFADHYFRVLADAKAQKDEQRARRDDEREQNYGDDYDDEDQGQYQRPRRASRNDSEGEETPEGNVGAEGEEFEPVDNPFMRESAGRGAGRRNTRKPARPAVEDSSDQGEGAQAIDAAALPPSIAREEAPAEEAQEKPKPRRRAPRKRPADGDSETLAAIG